LVGVAITIGGSVNNPGVKETVCAAFAPAAIDEVVTYPESIIALAVVKLVLYILFGDLTEFQTSKPHTPFTTFGTKQARYWTVKSVPALGTQGTDATVHVVPSVEAVRILSPFCPLLPEFEVSLSRPTHWSPTRLTKRCHG
jgi:hypothetical protein